ncbi:MAG: hypothetical protein V4638_05150 [Bacteroidota bacterium]
MATDKKVTRVGDDGDHAAPSREEKVFVASDESKGKAKQFRLFSILFWLGGIIAQVFAIRMLLKVPQGQDVSYFWMILLIAIDLALVVTGSWFWKKANRLDPPSDSNGLLFWMQSQLGMLTAIIAFLPLVIFILTNKNISGKQKAILGSIAGVAMLIAGITGYDFNPPSQEQYTKQINEVEELQADGANLVFWTKSGTKYHLSDSCSYINGKRTDEIFTGTLQKAREEMKITDLCSLCKSRAEKIGGTVEQVGDKVTDVVNDVVTDVKETAEDAMEKE